MKKQIIRKISILLCITLAIESVCLVRDVSALSRAKYTKQTIDKSTTFGKVKVEEYYELIQLKGDTPAIQKINKALRKDCNKFLKSSYVEYIKDYSKEINYDDECYWTASSYVKYNKKGIISIKVESGGWLGRVGITDEYGLNYSLKTGKRIYLHQACRKSKKTTKKTLIKVIKKQKDFGTQKKYALKRVKKMKVKKIDFYIKKNGKVMAIFDQYEIGNFAYTQEFKVGKRK